MGRKRVELLPCPFCGGSAEIRIEKRYDGTVLYAVKFIRCTNCLASTMMCFDGGYHDSFCSDEEIAEMWNHRVPGKSIEDCGESGDRIVRGELIDIWV